MANRYWVGGDGNWSDYTNHWAATSGGSPGASLPTSADSVFFDSNSHTASYAVTVDATSNCLDMTWANPATGSPTLTGGSILNVYGSLSFVSGMTVSYSGTLYFMATSGTKTITTNGVTLGCYINIYQSATFQLQDNFVITGAIYFKKGVFDANNKNVTVLRARTAETNTRSILMGSGTWTITGVDWSIYKPWEFSVNTGLTLNAGTSTIKFTNNSSTDKTFDGGGLAYNNFWIATAGTGKVIIVGSNTFNDLKIDAGRSVQFTDGTDQTVTTFTAVGSAGNLIVLNGTSTAGWKISCSGDQISCDYLNIDYSTGEGGAMFYAGANSTDGGHNTNWTFTAAPSLPTVTTQDATDISNPLSTATGNGNITATGGENASKRGMIYSASSHSLPGNVAPSASGYESNVEDAGSFGTGAFTKQMINLKLQQPSSFSAQYAEEGDFNLPAHFRIKIRVYSYWLSEAGRVYSANYLESDSIGSDNEETYWRGVFAWGAVSGVTGYRVLFNLYNGESWIGWTSGEDYTSNSITINAYLLDTGKTAVTPAAGTTYYARAYAKNSTGYSYGGEITFVEPSGGYTLAISTGSFTMTGIDTSFLASRKCDISPGSFALSGIDLSLLASRKIDMSSGAFTLTGIDLSLLAARTLGITPGSFVLTGIDLSVKAARILGISPGAFVLTGIDVTLTKTAAGYVITISPGSFALTGIAASLKASRIIGMSPGSFILTGIDAILQIGAAITPDRRYAKEAWDSLERVWESGEKVNPFGKNIFTKHFE